MHIDKYMQKHIKRHAAIYKTKNKTNKTYLMNKNRNVLNKLIS